MNKPHITFSRGRWSVCRLGSMAAGHTIKEAWANWLKFNVKYHARRDR